SGEITQDDAVEFVFKTVNGGVGGLKGWGIARGGERAQVKRGEGTHNQFLRYTIPSTPGKEFPYKGGRMAQTYRNQKRKPHVASRRTQMLPGHAMDDMGGVTGTPCAAFAVLALQQRSDRAGVFFPEDWADPTKFYDALEACGVPRAETVEAF